MADDTNDTDNLGPLLADVGKYGLGSAGVAGANATMQAAYQAIIKNLQDRFGDYDKMGPAGYKDISAQQLGNSALSGVQNDAQARADEQASIAQLDDIAKSGGLNLSDKNALNQLEQTLGRNTAARNASTANQYAARGQLGSGQQLQMELAANQNATQNANQRGESIAAQAQQRAMDAVLKKGAASRELSNDDYARKKAAAEAQDSIARYNASMRTDASKHNNTLAGQRLEDQLKKLQGQTGLTNSLNTALLGSGTQNANSIAGQTKLGTGLVDSLGRAIPKGGGGGGGGSGGGTGDPNSTSGDTPDAPGEQGSRDYNENLQPDPSDPGGGGGEGDAWGSLLDEGESFA